jgi:hypothetical protein
LQEENNNLTAYIRLNVAMSTSRLLHLKFHSWHLFGLGDWRGSNFKTAVGVT